MQIRTLVAGAILTGAACFGGTAIPAAADTTCYTGCTTPTTGIVAQTTPAAPAAAPVPPASGLAFTGADIEEMAILGLVAIGAGSLLIRRRKTA